MESIPWAAIGGLTPSGLLILAVWLVLTGRIVPKSTYDVMVSAKESWRDAATKKDAIIHTQAETIRDQSAVSETVVKVMTAVQDANKAGDRS